MRFLTCLATLLLLVSCSQVPREEAYPLSHQKKLQASDHWYQLSYKIASDWGPLAKAASGSSLYISQRDNSSFGKAMQTLLTTEFFNNGVSLARSEASTLQLDWEVLSVYHAANRRNAPGFAQILLLEFPQALVFGEAEVAKFVPHHEVIITFNLKSNNALYARRTAIFYVNDLDALHYNSFSWSFTSTDLQPTVKYRVVDTK